MPKDKYTAVWLSHSSINDYIKCPRLYYLRNVYKDPKTGHKVTIVSGALTLGQTVHDTIQELAKLPVEKRFEFPLLKKFDLLWEKSSGKKGGFKTREEEETYKQRGHAMITRLIENPGPLLNKAIPAKSELPHYWLSEEDNIILCGKIDWLEYNEKDDSVSILDFKTGKHEEDSSSLQLPIYNLLVNNIQTRRVDGAYYWYLDKDNAPKRVELPDIKDSFDRVYEIAKRIALARKLDRFVCNTAGGCKHCFALEKVVNGGGELVGLSEYKQDIYII